LGDALDQVHPSTGVKAEDEINETDEGPAVPGPRVVRSRG
jgi:hypothetical protein